MQLKSWELHELYRSSLDDTLKMYCHHLTTLFRLRRSSSYYWPLHGRATPFTNSLMKLNSSQHCYPKWLYEWHIYRMTVIHIAHICIHKPTDRPYVTGHIWKEWQYLLILTFTKLFILMKGHTIQKQMCNSSQAVCMVCVKQVAFDDVGLISQGVLQIVWSHHSCTTQASLAPSGAEDWIWNSNHGCQGITWQSTHLH